MRFAAWVTYWDFEQGFAAVADSASPYEDVYLFAVHLDPSGKPTPANPEIDLLRAVKELRAQGRRVWMTVVNDVQGEDARSRRLKDPGVVHRILVDPELQAVHRKDIRTLAVETGFSGVDIDYENLFVDDKDAFTAFVRHLARDLDAFGLELSVTVQPKSDDSPAQGRGAMDWRALCGHVDWLQIMIYNLHNQGTPPGPLATPRWLRKVLEYAERQCRSDRLTAVLKVSGMQWGPAGARGVHYQEAVSLLTTHQAKLERHLEGRVPYFSYQENGGEFTVYYEDVESLAEKIDSVESSGLRRIVFWSLGHHDPRLTEALIARERKP